MSQLRFECRNADCRASMRMRGVLTAKTDNDVQQKLTETETNTETQTVSSCVGSEGAARG
jgi:hypothetical protein